MKDKDNKTITMPLHEYEQMLGKISELEKSALTEDAVKTLVGYSITELQDMYLNSHLNIRDRHLRECDNINERHNSCISKYNHQFTCIQDKIKALDEENKQLTRINKDLKKKLELTEIAFKSNTLKEFWHKKWEQIITSIVLLVTIIALLFFFF